MTVKNNPSDTADREILITRVINAPRELVFEAMVDPNQVGKWWGPVGFSTTIHEMDVRPGGAWRHTMKGPDGAEYPNKSIFKEIVRPERIVFSHAGGRVEGGQGVNFQATWTFEAQGNKTKVTLHSIFPTAEERDRVVREFNAVEGGKQTLSRMEEYLSSRPGKHPFTITRTFDAPRELVWKCWTEPERMAQWWGPKGAKVLSSKMDFRVGGSYHYGMSHSGMGDTWGKMIFREISAPGKLVFINAFSDEKGGIARHPMSPTWPAELLSTITFVENQGKTTVTIEWLPLNATEEEWKTFNTGRESMKMGWGGSLERLSEYLTTS